MSPLRAHLGRRVRLVLLACVAAPIAASAQTASTPAASRPDIGGPVRPTATRPADALQRVDDGLWRVAGTGGIPDGGNGGRTQNAWLVRLERRTLLVDPGPDPARTARIARAARALNAPVAWVIDTHPHPETVLGNAGAPSDAQVLASRAADRLMRERCPDCRRRFIEAIGVKSLAGAGVALRHPDRAIDDGALRLGATTWQALDLGATHSDADLVLFEPGSGLLLTGGVAGCGVLPALTLDATPDRWIDALARLRALPARRLAGGEGPACEAGPALTRTQGYLETLRARLAALVAEGATGAGIEARVPPFDALSRSDPARHALNVQRAFRAMEDASFESPAPR